MSGRNNYPIPSVGGYLSYPSPPPPPGPIPTLIHALSPPFSLQIDSQGKHRSHRPHSQLPWFLALYVKF
ncbi:hypothetical protein RRG08_024137 [Elysia crispata]|uniref:Uncharacterized protein n=1 Tax=Elysia crispata TaxID=231223 RepID=A0AAE0YQ94_9GAST|nr:hypothetical protein RRG08_024137 [Elysia crispata]